MCVCVCVCVYDISSLRVNTKLMYLEKKNTFIFIYAFVQ